ncbi:acyl-CoA dehydrogenase family protein [Salsuginibacillus kocurii]|uniref:acyl-CoA dehydrogenase family protein n=1 Tax=Salsuginibacillus kocurii TaxID=427078 RepID=UPI00036A6C4F|nr:acyl-CoA dehydrogenase family protein [Salsuginibacillus kocurii]
MKLLQLSTVEERIKELEKVTARFTERAAAEEKAFPYENFKELKDLGYPALTVPKKFGGAGISLLEMVQLQETLGKADGSTALSIGWHMGITKHLGDHNIWEEHTYQQFANDVLHRGSLLNNAASEAGTGSPSRGALPATTAHWDGSSWILNGRKNFTTMAPILDYFVVSATVSNTEEVANFLVRRESKGLTIEETWDSVAMQGTGSHDLVLTDVNVSEKGLVQYLSPGNKGAAGWLLHVPACYLGIARAAQSEAIQFAHKHSPSSIEGVIADIPAVKQRLGEIELNIWQSQTLLYATAQKWDQSTEEVRQSMKAELGAVKLTVVNHAIHVVDKAMRVVGASSLSENSPLQRYYRDVRAGLHNPPMDDMTILALADRANNREK